jgi:hypothetical protein
MKNFLIATIFLILVSLGIFLDSLLVDWICSFLTGVSAAWLVTIKVGIWAILSFFTGGIIFAASFIAAGAIKTTLDR